MSLFDELGIQHDAIRAVEGVVMEIAEAVRVKVSIDVDYSVKPPARSKTGEPPRRDTGDYYHSIGSDVEDNGDTIIGSAYTDDWKAVMLEYDGFGYGMRPHWTPVEAEYEPRLMDRFDFHFRNG